MSTTTDSPLVQLAQVYDREPHSLGPEEAPVNVTAPYLGGDATDGGTLTTTMGTWNGMNNAEPEDYKYLWYSDGEVIEGQGGSTYAVVAGDAGATINSRVMAKNSVGETLSLPSNPVTVPGEERKKAAEKVETKAPETKHPETKNHHQSPSSHKK